MLTINPKQIAKFLAFVVVGLTLVGFIGQCLRYGLNNEALSSFVHLFNLNNERNIPAWYAASTLMFSALLLAIISAMKKKEKNPYFRHWVGLSILFSYLSLDEYLSLHEELHLRFFLERGSFIYSDSWVFVATLFLIILLLFYHKFLWELPPATKRLFLLAAFLYTFGAVGMEIIAAYQQSFQGKENLAHALLVIVEEFLEKVGIVVFIYGLLDYISAEIKDIRIEHSSK